MYRKEVRLTEGVSNFLSDNFFSIAPPANRILKREDTKLINKLIKNIINEKDKSGHSFGWKGLKNVMFFFFFPPPPIETENVKTITKMYTFPNISNILNKNNNTEKNKFSNNNYYDKTGENCNVLFWCEKNTRFFSPKI